MMPKSESNLQVGSDLSLETEPELQQSFPIAAIGASAGGLDAFTQLLKNLPSDTGMGFVLIQHLAPEHDSQLSEILRRTTQMPVNEAQEGMRIVPNSVYVIPPKSMAFLVHWQPIAARMRSLSYCRVVTKMVRSVWV